MVAAINETAAELGPIRSRPGCQRDLGRGPVRPAGAAPCGAVVGLGMMGRNHVRVYDEVLAGVELVAVADPDAAALRRATTGRAARGYPDAGTMFAEERLDLVSIVAPTSLHRQATLDALAAGVNVLVEKPIASDRAEAEAMIAAAARRGAAPHRRATSSASTPRSASCAGAWWPGELGRIFQIKATRLGPFPARIRDVGVVLDLAPHDLDIMRFLARVRSRSGSTPRPSSASTPITRTCSAAILKFANGCIGVLDINWLTPTKMRTLSVTGERGMYVADYINQDLVYYANPDAAQTWEQPDATIAAEPITSVSEGEMARRVIHRQEPLAVELAEFARAVRTGEPRPGRPARRAHRPAPRPEDGRRRVARDRRRRRRARRRRWHEDRGGRARPHRSAARGPVRLARPHGHRARTSTRGSSTRWAAASRRTTTSRRWSTRSPASSRSGDAAGHHQTRPRRSARRRRWSSSCPVVVDAAREIDFGQIDAATRDVARALRRRDAGHLRDDAPDRHHARPIRAGAGRGLGARARPRPLPRVLAGAGPRGTGPARPAPLPEDRGRHERRGDPAGGRLLPGRPRRWDRGPSGRRTRRRPR